MSEEQHDQSRQPGSDAARADRTEEESLSAAPQGQRGQLAVRRNEELGHLGAVSELPVGPEPSARSQAPVPPARLSGGVPAAAAPTDAPAVEAAGGDPEHTDVWNVRRVANAVQGRPDGEVDPRPNQPATGTDTP
ncbi:hypothetical protein [Salinactinospora qingdaonensis]|uniref:Uncharacterized protein n=1 Tax=Salinactinospora qingdaonensis TaxID=702744 RepID=A0ABP7FWM7_9ACTN